MVFLNEDKRCAKALDEWVRDAVKSIGVDNTRTMLEVMLRFDFTKINDTPKPKGDF